MDYVRKNCLFIDMSVQTDSFISVKKYNKIIKYKDLKKKNVEP